jgi:hypothetical protein
MRCLTVDGMLSGTGIRDPVEGGYIDPHELGLSDDLVRRIEKWLLEYEAAHYDQFLEKSENERLDLEGFAITRLIREEMFEAKVDYFSNAEMRRIAVI